MRIRLYVVHGSHPCAAVEKALSLKGLPYTVVEWPPPMHIPMQTVIFGGRTVPGLTISHNGSTENVHRSSAIMRRLDELAPEPPLFPRGEKRRAVEEAEQWGDQFFQPVARELIWAAMVNRPDALPTYSVHSRLRLPDSAVRAIAPGISRLGRWVNRTGDEVARSDLQALPGQLDEIDGWIADGTMGDAQHPNAADLQIASTIRLMLTLADARPLIEGRPCERLARELFPDADGEMPAGAIAA